MEERERWETRERKKIQDSIDALWEVRRRAEERKRRKDMEEEAGNQQEEKHCSNEESREKIQRFVEETFEAYEELTTNISHDPTIGPPILIQTADMPPDMDPYRHTATGRGSNVGNNGTSLGMDAESGCVTHESQGEMNKEGSLTTGLADEEEIEVVPLEATERLFIDDLPDLEDEDITELPQNMLENITTNQVYRPKIEVISGDSDESDGEWEKEDVTTVGGDDDEQLTHHVDIFTTNTIDLPASVNIHPDAAMSKHKSLLIQEISNECLDERGNKESQNRKHDLDSMEAPTPGYVQTISKRCKLDAAYFCSTQPAASSCYRIVDRISRNPMSTMRLETPPDHPWRQTCGASFQTAACLFITSPQEKFHLYNVLDTVNPTQFSEHMQIHLQ
ncbi:unnamed protein product [Ranitomeya imitator]|uniref:Uncharacterized protein n=1 Tax=Ranitomeya imitator TaxID=111125 RepID=A0ABN9LF51_9NEOB|nr:unnamed protein product [Ranitomeya imitator]